MSPCADPARVDALVRELHAADPEAMCPLCGAYMVDRLLHATYHAQVARLQQTVTRLDEAASPNPGRW